MDVTYVRDDQTMASALSDHMGQTCLRLVWARWAYCLHIADRLSRGKHLAISSVYICLSTRGTEDKRLVVVALVISSALNKSTLLRYFRILSHSHSSSPRVFSRRTRSFDSVVKYRIRRSPSTAPNPAANTKSKLKNVLPQVHALSKVHCTRPTPHSHVPEEHNRRRLPGHFL